VTKNPEETTKADHWNSKRRTLGLNFVDCNTECDQPEAIRSVYIVDGNVDDNDILNDKVNDDQKAMFEQIDSSSFQVRVPDGVIGSNT